MSTLNYIDENGNINKAGVIPKNYPASLIKMANGQSVEDTVKNISIKQEELTTSSNVNDCIDEYTTYFITGANRPINAPTNSAYNQLYWVRYFTGTTGIVQFCACRNATELYMRFRWAGDWGSWVKFTVS